MKERFLYLFKSYALTVIVFIVAKVSFMVFCHEGHAFSVGDMVDVVIHGLTLDLSTALYLICPPLVLLIANRWFTGSKWALYSLRSYWTLVAFLLALAFVADISLYPFWGFKLDASCLQYLDTPTEAMASVSFGYLMLRLLALILLTALLTWAYWLFEPFKNGKDHQGHRVAETILYVALVPLIVIGIRGGLDESTTNIGQVYFSQNQFLNHAAVNPVFSFIYSASHQPDDLSAYHFMEESECDELTKDIYTTESIHCDTLLNTQRPDIVLILLESCGEQFASIMPRLQRIKQEGIYFSQCFGNSWRTDRGTVCTLSGYPSFPTLSVMKMPEKSRTLPSIARSLQKENYKTSFIYGGDINFTNMRGYLIATGWETLTWKADYDNEQQGSAKWGVRDDITFGTLREQLQKLAPASARQERYLIGYSTLSSHEPWDVPVKNLDDEVLNAFSYLDSCIGNFMDSLKATPQWENLLIVLVADHGVNYKNIDEQKPLERNHIPLVLTGGAIKSPRVVNTLCNQTDIAATLLGQMGIAHDDFRFSRDVLSETYIHPTATHNYSNAQWLMDSTGYVLYNFDARQSILTQGGNTERLERINKAILQKTTEDLMKR